MRYLFDSSVFISFFYDNDKFHNETEEFLNQLLDEKEIKIIVPAIVMFEVANTLNKKLANFDYKTLLNFFSKFEIVDLNIKLAKELIPLFDIINLKTSDAIIVGISKVTDSILLSWDEKIIKEAKKVTKVNFPKF